MAGVNVIEIVQEAFAARDAGQLLVSANELALAPVSEMPVMVSEPAPELVSVTICGALVVPLVAEKLIGPAGISVTAGVLAAVPLMAYTAEWSS